VTGVDRPLRWDNHACMPLREDVTQFLPQLARYKSAGVDAVTVNVSWDGMPPSTAVKMLARMRAWLRDHAEAYALVTSAQDLSALRSTGRLGVLFNIEGGSALEGDVALLSLYADLGVRWMSIAYNTANALGGGCLDPDDQGLTAFGRLAVDEMAKVGVVPCCSHTGHRTASEVLERALGPVIFSHSNPSAIHAHPRNIPDELILACAATGGTIGINGIGDFLGEASVERFVRHADYVANLVGPEYLAIGLDYVFDVSELAELVAADPERFPGEMGLAQGFPMLAPEDVPRIADALMGAGWDEAAISGLLGSNLQRVAEAAWSGLQ
jgi:membrane dipeptidase